MCLRLLALARWGAWFCLALVLTVPGSASGAGRVSRNDGPIVGSAQTAPWSVSFLYENGIHFSQCSGTLIDLSHVLTAGHCVTDESTGTLYPVGDYAVNVGIASEADLQDLQVARVGAVNVMPGYKGDPADDVAILTLAQPLTATPEVQPIGIATAGDSPTVGTNLTFYGWGQSTSGSSNQNEHYLQETVQPPWTCEAGASSVICASSNTGDACPGDSGSGLISMASGSPVVVGVADTDTFPLSLGECTYGGTTGFADLSSPQMQDWLAGQTSAIVLGPTTDQAPTFSISSARVGAMITCKTPNWTGAESTEMLFINHATNEVLQSGRSTSFVVPHSQLGNTIGCVAEAQNAGGVAYIPSNSWSAAIAARIRPALAFKVRSNGDVRLVSLPPASLRFTLSVTSHGRARFAFHFKGRTRTVAKLRELPAGAYRLCISSSLTGIYAAAKSCHIWTRRV